MPYSLKIGISHGKAFEISLIDFVAGLVMGADASSGGI
jgi:hypothetical protein